MSSNQYTNYYINQAGSGIGGFQGARFQGGQGFFGNVFRGAILPLMKYLGKTALSTGVNVAKDALGGENFMDSLKNRGKEAVRGIASDAADRATRFVQTGKGRKRKRIAKKKKTAKKSKRFAGLGHKKTKYYKELPIFD